MGSSSLTKKVTILGSCVTRDAFGSEPSELGFDVLCTVSRSSFLSATCSTTALQMPEFGSSTRFERQCVEMDLFKTGLSKLTHGEPDLIIIDLIDERFDIMLGEDGHIATASAVAKNDSNIFSHAGSMYLDVPRKWRGVNHAFQLAADRLADHLLSRAPQAKIVIHRAFWADRSKQDGQVKNAPADVIQKAKRNNNYLDNLYQMLISRLPDAVVINIGSELLVSDPNHRWGPAPFHYISAYYDAFIDALKRNASEVRGSRSLTASARTAEHSPHYTLREDTNFNALVGHLHRRSLKGEPELALRLGEMLLRDGLVQADPDSAFDLLVFASLAGLDRAILRVGECLIDGVGSPREVERGLEWIRFAERRGVPEAQYAIGRLHLEGRYLSKRPDASRAYFRRAAEQGVSAAARSLSYLFEAGLGGDVDQDRARFWLKKSQDKSA